METKFSQVAHLYLRCKVHLENHTDGCTYSTLEGLDPFDGCTLLHWGDDDEVGYRTDEVSLETINPILKHISDMPVNEKIELIALRNDELPENITLLHNAKTYVRYYDGETEEDDTEAFIEKHMFFDEFTPDQFTYLLSKGYDLFNLIETGQAINAKKD